MPGAPAAAAPPAAGNTGAAEAQASGGDDLKPGAVVTIIDGPPKKFHGSTARVISKKGKTKWVVAILDEGEHQAIPVPIPPRLL